MSIIILLAMSFAFARENIFSKAVESTRIEEHMRSASLLGSKRLSASMGAITVRSNRDNKNPPRNAVPARVSGNLDREILVSSSYRVEESSEIVPKEKPQVKLKDVRVGDVLRAEIQEEVMAFPDSKTPVKAIVIDGRLKGSILIGEATLEKNSKKVQINFHKFISNRGEDVYQLAGYSLVKGEHFSNEPKFFLAELLAAGAAGFADASVERSQNVLGNYVEAPTLGTASKKSLAAALGKSAERFAEKMRSAPEYTVLRGRGEEEVSVLITDQPSTQ